MMREMMSVVLEEALDGELDEELGYSRYDYKNKDTKNSRNGHSKKTMHTSYGDMELDIPRDRDGEFEPQIIQKHQNTLTQDMENKILSASDLAVRKGLAEESNSITSQRKLLYDFIHNKDEFFNSNVTEYFDDGTSGTLFAKRDRFQDMLQAAQSGEIDCIIVKDLSRFGRDYLEVGYYTEILFPMLGVRFISVNDNFDTNKLNGATGGMEFALKNLMHQMYSADLSKKIRTGRMTRNKAGQCTFSFAPCGYKKDPKDKHKLIIDNKYAKIIREVFNSSAAGMTTTEIARSLNKRGVYKNREGASARTLQIWMPKDIRKILENEMYIGNLVQNRYETVGFGDNKKTVERPREEWVIIEGCIPPIIEKNLFDKVNASLVRHDHRGVRQKRQKNLFVCPYCGRKMVVTKGKKEKLQCTVKDYTPDSLCNSLDFYASDIQNKALEAVRSICKIAIDKNKLRQERQEDTLRELKAEMMRMEQEKKLLASKPTMLYFDFKSGNMTKDEFISAKEAVNKRITEIDTRLMEIDEAMAATLNTDVNMDNVMECGFLQSYDGDILAKLIQKIYVYTDGNIEIVFDCKDFFQSCLNEN